MGRYQRPAALVSRGTCRDGWPGGGADSAIDGHRLGAVWAAIHTRLFRAVDVAHCAWHPALAIAGNSLVDPLINRTILDRNVILGQINDGISLSDGLAQVHSEMGHPV